MGPRTFQNSCRISRVTPLWWDCTSVGAHGHAGVYFIRTRMLRSGVEVWKDGCMDVFCLHTSTPPHIQTRILLQDSVSDPPYTIGLFRALPCNSSTDPRVLCSVEGGTPGRVDENGRGLLFSSVKTQRLQRRRPGAREWLFGANGGIPRPTTEERADPTARAEAAHRKKAQEKTILGPSRGGDGTAYGI